MKKSVLHAFRRFIQILFCGLLCLAGATEAGAQCLNHALDFDGNDDAVTCTLNSPLGNSDFTFEAWITSTATGTTANCTGTNTFRRLFQLANSGLSPNRIDLGECNGYVTVAWQDFFGFHGPYVTTGFIRDNNWHNIAMVKTLGQIKVYLDCVLIFTATDYATVGNFFITNVTLGATPFNGPNYWKGKVDEVRLWPDAHSDTQVCDERFCPVPKKGMTLYWPMDEGVPHGNNFSVTHVGTSTNMGTLSNFQLSGYTSNFDCSTAPVNYPNYFPLHVEIKDPLNQNLITQMCNGEAAHFCLVNPDGSSPAPAANTVIAWQQSDDNGFGFGPYIPVTSAAFSSNDFCFVVPKDNITFDCATSTRGYVDRRYIAFITVTQNGQVCDFFTANAVVRICCPVTEASVQMTVTPGGLINSTLCEGDQVDVDVTLTSATHPFINPPGGALSIVWEPPFSSHNGQTSFTETLTVGEDDLCATATITNCACAPPLVASACVPVDPVPKCGPMTGLLIPNNLLPDPDGDPSHYLICPGDDAALGAVFDDCTPHWQYSFDQISWTELGVSNTEQNTNILPTSAWGTATCIYYRVECRPMSDPSGCDPCYCGIVRICLKPPPLKPVIVGDDLICKSDMSSLLSVQTPEAGVTYTWYCNGKEVSTGVSIDADMNACYRVKADNGCETALSDPFCLKICEVFAIISCPLAPNDCVEPGVPIELSGADSYSTCGGPLVYAWSSNNTTLAGPVDQPILEDTPDMNGTTYTLMVTDQNSCKDTKSTLVKPCKR